jgi:hypothetical protein
MALVTMAVLAVLVTVFAAVLVFRLLFHARSNRCLRGVGTVLVRLWAAVATIHGTLRGALGPSGLTLGLRTLGAALLRILGLHGGLVATVTVRLWVLGVMILVTPRGRTLTVALRRRRAAHVA